MNCQISLSLSIDKSSKIKIEFSFVLDLAENVFVNTHRSTLSAMFHMVIVYYVYSFALFDFVNVRVFQVVQLDLCDFEVCCCCGCR